MVIARWQLRAVSCELAAASCQLRWQLRALRWELCSGRYLLRIIYCELCCQLRNVRCEMLIASHQLRGVRYELSGARGVGVSWEVQEWMLVFARVLRCESYQLRELLGTNIISYEYCPLWVLAVPSTVHCQSCQLQELLVTKIISYENFQLRKALLASGRVRAASCELLVTKYLL